MNTITEAKPGPDRTAAIRDGEHRITEHASTPQGAIELSRTLALIEERPPSTMRRKAFAAHCELVAMLRHCQRRGQTVLDCYTEMVDLSPNPSRLAVARREKAAAHLATLQRSSDRHADAKDRGIESRRAAAYGLSGAVNAPIIAAGLREWDEVALPHRDSGIRERHTVTSTPAFSTVADPNTGEPVTQVTVYVRAAGERDSHQRFFTADEELAAIHLERG